MGIINREDFSGLKQLFYFSDSGAGGLTQTAGTVPAGKKWVVRALTGRCASTTFSVKAQFGDAADWEHTILGESSTNLSWEGYLVLAAGDLIEFTKATGNLVVLVATGWEFAA